MNLQGRVALITGGGGHIGAAMCETLAELGAAIVVLDVVRESCTDVAKRAQET
jgi:NAD(P)-dependent dehydrogenase (short-subunit alcohol dehydrogenase family)